MPQLVHAIILPADQSRWIERLKVKIGIGGVAASMRAMGVDPIAAQFMAIQFSIDEVTNFAHELWQRHFLDSEMPPEVIHVSRVNYLVGQVLNGGFTQFIHNSGWVKSFVDETRGGLKAIGAVEHLAVFNGAAEMIDHNYRQGGKLDVDRFSDQLNRLEKEHLSNAKLSKRLGVRIDSSWNWGNRWEVAQALSAHYISAWRNVRRVAPDRYDIELDNLMPAIPDLAARKATREDTRSWEKKRIDQLIAAAGQSEIWYTAFSARELDGQQLWAWNLTTSTGHHYVVFHAGEALLFKGDTDAIVARVPAPEQREDSGVASNQPQQKPGSLEFNLVLRINNP